MKWHDNAAMRTDHDLTTCLCADCCGRRKTLLLEEIAKPRILYPPGVDVPLDVQKKAAYFWGYSSGSFEHWLPEMRRSFRLALAVAKSTPAVIESFEVGVRSGQMQPSSEQDAVASGAFKAFLEAKPGAAELDYRPAKTPAAQVN